jgi:hypothetical protein
MAAAASEESPEASATSQSATPTPVATVKPSAGGGGKPFKLSAELATSLTALQSSLEQQLQTWLADGELLRDDGYVYAIDIAQLLIYFANQGDFESYTIFREIARQNLIIDDPSDPYTQGFVAWRYRPGQEVDASGTTEALWIAKGFWLGGERFNNPLDTEYALLILDGYGKHAFVDQDIWFIRNYFNLGTRSFASNSYLVDYYPDFIQEVADVREDKELATLAQNSADLIRVAQAPSGLVHSLVLPELKTLYPEFEITAFSPNDIIQLSNACFTVETGMKSDPLVAREFLDFAKTRADNLNSFYYGRTGEAATKQPATLSDLLCLLRLAITFDEDQLAQKVITQAAPFWQEFNETPYNPRFYAAGQILLTIDVMME